MPVNLQKMDIVPPLLPVPIKMLQSIKQTGAEGLRMKKIVDVYNYLYILYYRLVKVKPMWDKMDDEKKATFVAENKELAKLILFRIKKIKMYLPEQIAQTMDVSTIVPEITRVVKIINREDENEKYSSENIASVAILKNAVKQLSMFFEALSIKVMDYTNNKLGIRRGVGRRKLMPSQVFLGGRLKYNTDREQVTQEGREKSPELYNEVQDLKNVHSKLMDKIIESQGMHELEEEEIQANEELEGADKEKRIKMFHAIKRSDFGVKFVVNKQGQEFVVTKEGEIIPVRDYIEHRKERRKTLNKFDRITGVQVNKQKFNMANDTLVAKLYESAKDNDAVEFKALSDDLGSDKSLVKVVPIVKINGEEIVADGQFKNVPVAELINSQGRVFEASGYSIDENSSVPQKVEYFTKTTSIDEAAEEEKELNFRLNTEPYITVHNGKMLIAVPPIKVLVEKMMVLDDASHTMTMYTKRDRDEKGRLVKIDKLLKEKKIFTWIFDIELDFEMIRDALGTLSMSKAAAKKVNDYLISKRNAEIRRKEKQYLNIKETDFKNLKQKTAEKQQDIRLFASQKEAIKFVLDKGRGLVGLDTGCGKTLVAICVILKWIEDGTLRQKGRNGKALIVAEASLQGNFQREIENYCDNASEIMKHIDIITYQGFTKGMVLGEAFQHGAASYDKLENYGAVIFDEAQALKNIPKMKNIEEKEETGEEATGDVEEAFLDEKETDDTNEELKAKGIKKTMNRAMAAHSLNHEHKVLLTASVMEKNPEEFFNLVSITNNEPLETLEIRKKEFKRRHLNTTGKFGGGRVIGVKGDKKSKRIMGDFVRENCVSVRKDQNKIITPEGKEELVPIPKLIKESPSITVDRRLQDIYLEIASPMLNTLKKMTGDFEALAKDPTKVETEGIGIFQKYTKGEGMEVTSKEDAYNQFIKIFRMLQLLSSAPTNLIPAYPAYFEARPEMKAVLEQADKYDSKLKFITGQIDKEQDEKWILWTDTPLIADYYYANLTKAFPSREIAVAYANKILIQKGGERQKEYVESIVESKLKEKTGRKEFERVEWKDVDGKPMKYNKNWQIDALKEIKKKPEVLVLILTKAYTKGHNLQNFTRTIHLDRDSFNNQNMQQRDARNHRNGANPEKDMVSFTPDAVLDEKYASFSVDKIRKYLQDLEQHIFDVVIRQSFENVPERPYEMKVEGPSQMILKKKKEMLHKAISQMKIDKKTLEYILSPTVNTIKEIEK